MAWPGPFVEPEGDVERGAWKMSEGIVDFVLIQSRASANLPPQKPVSFRKAVMEIRKLYATEHDLDVELKRKKKEVTVATSTVPQDRPKTVMQEKGVGFVGGKRKVRGKSSGWVATDPAWRAVVGSGRTRWGAEHSLRVQIAAVAWRRMGGRIGCGPGSPLPCVLTKQGSVWTASSWREGLPAEFGVGRTVEEALSSLVHVRGGAPELRHSAVEWKDESSFRVFDKQESGWYGADPVD